uniref:agouti-signaling protein 2b n=1 Tax=Semicossyphus pulcher TaxID=241346 RepID=UPI0037E97020
MRKITGKHLLCFLLLVFPLSWAETTKKDVTKADNHTAVWSQAKTRRLFARRKISPPQESHVPKNKSNLMTPARRCGRLMESCSSNVPCCDPCASCRCRLFNTICHCWRMNPLCIKKA